LSRSLKTVLVSYWDLAFWVSEHLCALPPQSLFGNPLACFPMIAWLGGTCADPGPFRRRFKRFVETVLSDQSLRRGDFLHQVWQLL